MSDRLPIVILAGSDGRPGPVPNGMDPDLMLRTYKGALRLPSGCALAQELVTRLRETGRFQDPILVGPRQIYDRLIDCEVFDVEGNLAKTLAGVRQLVYDRFDLSCPVAVSSCDILPTANEIGELLATGYDPHRECMFWWQLVAAVPKELGASHWKPSYRLREDAGGPLKTVYPGHLAIFRPAALRIRLTNHLLQLAYSERNRDVRKRPARMAWKGLGRLLWEDLRNLFRLKLPVLAVSIPYHALTAYWQLRHDALAIRSFERHAAKALLHRDYHHAVGGRPVVFSLTRILSFAKDIDTQAELAEAITDLPCHCSG